MSDRALRDELMTLLVAGERKMSALPAARLLSLLLMPLAAHCCCQPGCWGHTEMLLLPLLVCLPPSHGDMPTAGQETSAILLSWTCAYLAHHPEAQAAAAAEVEARLGGSGGRALEAGDARQLPYVEAVVLEAMR